MMQKSASALYLMQSALVTAAIQFEFRISVNWELNSEIGLYSNGKKVWNRFQEKF